jgi:hypothetical protein
MYHTNADTVRESTEISLSRSNFIPSAQCGPAAFIPVSASPFIPMVPLESPKQRAATVTIHSYKKKEK